MTTSGRKKRHVDGRALVVVALLAYFAIVGSKISTHGWVGGWEFVHVDGTLPRFKDLTAVFQGWDRYRAGTPVAQIQSQAYETPRILSMAYPSIWLRLFAPLGLGEAQTFVFGVLLGIAVSAAALLFFGPLTLLEGAFAAALLVSPGLMFGIERGNVDLILFLIVLFGVWLLSTRFAAAPVVSAALLFFAGLLKLYPIAAVACFFKTRRHVLVFAPALLFTAYCLLLRRELRRIFHNAGRDTRWSFGCMVPFDRLDRWLMQHGHASHKAALELAGLALAILILGIVTAWTWRWMQECVVKPDLPGFAFLAGTAIYLLCFLIGNNYEYRFRWLILMIPQIFLWIRSRNPGWRRGLLALAMMLLATYATNITNDGRLVYVADPSNWLLFAVMVSLAAGALKTDMLRAFYRYPGLLRQITGSRAAQEESTTA